MRELPSLVAGVHRQKNGRRPKGSRPRRSRGAKPKASRGTEQPSSSGRGPERSANRIRDMGYAAAISIRHFNDGAMQQARAEGRFVGTAHWLLSLHRTMLLQNPARQSLQNMELQHDMLDTAATPGGAQKFPEATSLRMSFSSGPTRPCVDARSPSQGPSGASLDRCSGRRTPCANDNR